MRLRALLEAMLQDMHLIVITLAPTDDAQVIFETLNYGGEPLAAMDLVRNDVFHRAARNNENVDDLMDTGWAMFETPFWKERATQGRITKPRIDFFLAHALAAETGKETLLNELYAAYKRYSTDRNYPTVEAELQTLRKHAPTYQALVSPGARPDGEALLRARRLRHADGISIGVCFERRNVGCGRARGSLSADRVLHRTPRNLRSHTEKLQHHIPWFGDSHSESGGSLEALRAAFADYSGSSNLFPSDQDLRQAFTTRAVYESIPRPRLWYILRELEFASRDEYNEVEGLKPDLEIEHVLPQTWHEHWPLPDGSKAPPDLTHGLSEEQRGMVERRQAAIHTLGNLTLLTKPANLEVLNYAFDSEKKARLHASLLRINQDVAAETHWDEEAIVRRAQRLAEFAIEIWPAPNVVPLPESNVAASA